MAIAIEARIYSAEAPRDILEVDFAPIPELPISGGCGYSLEAAVNVDKFDRTVSHAVPFDAVAVEYTSVENILYEEYVIRRSDGDIYSEIQWTLLTQQCTSHLIRIFDKLAYEMLALPDREYSALKDQWEGPNSFGPPLFDVKHHMEEREARPRRYEAHYWFDVTTMF